MLNSDLGFWIHTSLPFAPFRSCFSWKHVVIIFGPRLFSVRPLLSNSKFHEGFPWPRYPIALVCLVVSLSIMKMHRGCHLPISFGSSNSLYKRRVDNRRDRREGSKAKGLSSESDRKFWHNQSRFGLYLICRLYQYRILDVYEHEHKPCNEGTDTTCVIPHLKLILQFKSNQKNKTPIHPPTNSDTLQIHILKHERKKKTWYRTSSSTHFIHLSIPLELEAWYRYHCFDPPHNPSIPCRTVSLLFLSLFHNSKIPYPTPRKIQVHDIIQKWRGYREG